MTNATNKDQAMTKATAMLRSISGLKRYDPNSIRGFKRSTITVNVPLKLLENIDEFLAAQPSQEQAGEAVKVRKTYSAIMAEELGYQPASTQAATADDRAEPGDSELERVAEAIMKGMRAIAMWKDRRTYAVRVLREAFAVAPASTGTEPLKNEPRNVDGMTRAEFEQHLRVCLQHDNVRSRERGRNAPLDGLTAEQEREIAERVELNYPASAYDYSQRCATPRDLHCNCEARAEASEQQLGNFDVAVKNLAVKHTLDRTTAGGWVFENHELFKFAHAVGQKYPNANTTEQEPRLDKRAQVGNTRFGVGIKWSTVIGAAQRHFEFMQTPEKEADRIANASQIIERIRNGRIAELEDREAENNDMLKALAECRAAFPIPEPGSPLEGYWASAMGDPLEVPGYIRAYLALRAAQPSGLPDYAFLVTEQEPLNDLSPLEVLHGSPSRLRFTLEPCQQRMLNYTEAERYGRVERLWKLEQVERANG